MKFLPCFLVFPFVSSRLRSAFHVCFEQLFNPKRSFKLYTNTHEKSPTDRGNRLNIVLKAILSMAQWAGGDREWAWRNERRDNLCTCAKWALGETFIPSMRRRPHTKQKGILCLISSVRIPENTFARQQNHHELNRRRKQHADSGTQCSLMRGFLHAASSCPSDGYSYLYTVCTRAVTVRYVATMSIEMWLISNIYIPLYVFTSNRQFTPNRLRKYVQASWEPPGLCGESST